ncbi:MAG TPA: cobalamin-dependent protein [Nocardioides sp.]
MVDLALQDAYWERVAANDAPGARALVEAALDNGVLLPHVLGGLVGDAQRRVGDLWAADEWTVAREHAATAVNEQVVHHLRGRSPRPAARDQPLLVVCAEREWHALPALLLTACLEHEGHAVAYLGADVSTTALQTAIADHEPRAALVSASLSSSLVFVRRHVEAATASGVPVVVGGAAFDDDGLRARRLGATAHAGESAAVAEVLATLPRRVPAVPPLRSEAAREAYALHAAIGAHTDIVTGRVSRSGGAATAAVLDQVPHVLGSLAAALLTDDDGIVAETRTWLYAVAAARGCSPETLAAVWSEIAAQVGDYPCGARMLAQAG